MSWRRDLASGFVSHGSGICDGFAPLTRSGPARFPGPATLDGHTWRLDEQLFTPGGDCDAQGRAAFALLTPDHAALVFVASPASQGHGGQDRLNYPWSVYLQRPPATGPYRRLATGFDDVRGMAIAPDGGRVAVAGRRGGTEGLWLLELSSGKLRQVSGGNLAYPSFAPDGSRVAVADRHDPDHGALRVIDLINRS